MRRYQSADKFTLCQLPCFTAPEIDYPGENPDTVVLIPLFASDKREAALGEYLVIAAVWARHAWLRNTDIVDHDIAVKFYVEEAIKGRVDLLLSSVPGVKEKDILYFDAEPYLGDPRTRMGKKLDCWLNPQLSSYERVIVADGDLFPIARDGHRMNFFEQ